MTLRPVDRDILDGITQAITQENYGFLYIDRAHEEIKDQYESREKSVLKAGSLSTSEIREALRKMADDENFSIERIRSGVFYWDPFGRGTRAGINDRLKGIFRDRIVVTTENIRQAFDLAHKDADFFADELRREGLLMRVAAGNREYYTVGTRLREETGEDDIDGKLKRRSVHGKISHEQLEDAIDVVATADVIGYLQSEGLVIDMEGAYLVTAALDEFARKAADDVADDVVAAFEDAGFVMPLREYEALVEAELDARSNVLAHVRSSGADLGQRDVIGAVRDRLAAEDGPGIETPDSEEIAVHRTPLDAQVENHAENLTRPVLADKTAATADTLKQGVREEIEALHLTNSAEGNAYVRARITEAAERRIDEEY